MDSVLPLINRGVISYWLEDKPAEPSMLIVGSDGNISYQDIAVAQWGSISGSIADQTDLQLAFLGKADTSHNHIIDDVTGLSTALADIDAALSALDTTKADASDLASYLPLAGGILTGSLTGTTGTFSGGLIATGLTRSGGTLALTGGGNTLTVGGTAGQDTVLSTGQSFTLTFGEYSGFDFYSGIYRVGGFQGYSTGRSFFIGSASDRVYLITDGANTLGLRNSTNANRLNLYGTYTDSSNYRRLYISSTTAGTFTLGVEGLGTGASGNTLNIASDLVLNGTYLTFGSNTIIGWSGKTQIRSTADGNVYIHAASSGTTGVYLTLGTNTLNVRNSSNNAGGTLTSGNFTSTGTATFNNTGYPNGAVTIKQADGSNVLQGTVSQGIEFKSGWSGAVTAGIGLDNSDQFVLRHNSNGSVLLSTSVTIKPSTGYAAKVQTSGGLAVRNNDDTGDALFTASHATFSSTSTSMFGASWTGRIQIVPTTSQYPNIKFDSNGNQTFVQKNPDGTMMLGASTIQLRQSDTVTLADLSCGSITSSSLISPSLVLRNSTTATRLDLYGTYTDASNYRRLYVSSTTGGAFTLGVEGLGTGASGNTLTVANNLTINGLLSIPSVGTGRRFIAYGVETNYSLAYTEVDSYGAIGVVATVLAALTTSYPLVSGYMAGDTYSRLTMELGNGAPVIGFGSGTAARDVLIRRNITGQLDIRADNGLRLRNLANNAYGDFQVRTVTLYSNLNLSGAGETFVPAAGGFGVNANSGGTFQWGHSLTNGFLISHGNPKIGFALSADSAPDVCIVRNSSGPTLDTWAAGGLRVRNADGSAAAALDIGGLTLRNSTTATRLDLYGTYTDASNYRRLYISSTTGGVFTLGVEGLGTGINDNELQVRFGNVDDYSNTLVSVGGILSVGLLNSLNRGSVEANLYYATNLADNSSYEPNGISAFSFTEPFTIYQQNDQLIHFITGNAGITVDSVNASLRPYTSSIADLGIATTPWSNLYLSGNITVPTDAWYGLSSSGSRFVPRTSSFRLYASNSLVIEGTSSSTAINTDLVTRQLYLRNSTNAMRMELYGTYTDASNYRRLYISSTTSGAFTLGIEGLGTGASGNTLAISTTTITTNPGYSNSQAFGPGHSMVGTGVTLIGSNINQGYSTSTVGIGYNLNAAGRNSVYIGNNNTAPTSGSVVAFTVSIGDSVTSGNNNVAIGSSAYTTDNSVAIGYAASDAGSGGVTIGRSASTTGTQPVAIGYYAVGNTRSIAIGRNTNAFASSIAIGDTAVTTAVGQLHFGSSQAPISMVSFPGATFSRINLGDATSANPAIKRNGTAINFRLADDSADAPISAARITTPSILLSGNFSTTAWTTSGVGISHTTRTLTDTSSSGTVAAAYTNVLDGNTIAASNATTYTDYASLFLGNPTAGTNVTITNSFSLIASGAARFGGNIATTANTVTIGQRSVQDGELRLNSSTGNGGIAIRGKNYAADFWTEINGNWAAYHHTRIVIGGVYLRSSDVYGWSSTGAADGTSDLCILRDNANTLAQRNSTNAQRFNLYGTYTDASNYRRLFLTSSTGGAFTIGSEGAGTGASGNTLVLTASGVTYLTLNNWTVSLAQRLAISVDTGGSSGDGGSLLAMYNQSGGAAATGLRVFASTGGYTNTGSIAVFGRRSGVGTFEDVLRIVGTTASGAIQFGGVTTSAPMLKRSGTTVQAKLADDSDFTAVQGKLTTNTNYTAGAVTPTGYIVLYDAAGTAYKIPAEAL